MTKDFDREVLVRYNLLNLPIIRQLSQKTISATRYTKNSSLSKVLITGGYLSIAGGVSTIHYYRQTTWVTSDKIYHPMESYKGKGLEAFNNFETLDYGARMYDPSIRRRHVIDPMSEIGWDEKCDADGNKNWIWTICDSRA